MSYVKKNTLKVGTTGIGNLYVGSTAVSRAYIGSTLVYGDMSNEYLTITCVENGVVSFIEDWSATTVQYSKNGGAWTNITFSSGNSVVSMAAGDTLMLKGTNTKYGGNMIRCGSTGTGKFNLSGNIMSLVGGDNFTSSTSLTADDALYKLFEGSRIEDASNLYLSATTLGDSAYYGLLQSCTMLKYPPKFPNTSVTYGDYCFSHMFDGCTGLLEVPPFPATPTEQCTPYCWSHTFYGCTSLTTTGYWSGVDRYNTYSCQYMFANCTNLTSAPTIPSTGTVGGVYAFYNMFLGCSRLASPPGMSFTNLAVFCFGSMFKNCTSLSYAPELPANTLAANCYNAMFEGCTSLTKAPILRAGTLVTSCYYRMFYGCSRLSEIKAYFLTTPSTSYTNAWVYGVASSGTFYKSPDASWNVIGAHGVPTNWTIMRSSGNKIGGIAILNAAAMENCSECGTCYGAGGVFSDCPIGLDFGVYDNVLYFDDPYEQCISCGNCLSALLNAVGNCPTEAIIVDWHS